MQLSSFFALVCSSILIGSCLGQVLIFDTHSTSSCDSVDPPRQYASTCGSQGEGCISVSTYNFYMNRSLCNTGETIPPPRNGFLAVKIFDKANCTATLSVQYDVSPSSAGQNVTVNGFSLSTFNPSTQTILMSCDANSGILSGSLCYPDKCTSFSVPNGQCVNIATLATSAYFSAYQDTCGSPAPVAAPDAGTPGSSGPASAPSSAPTSATPTRVPSATPIGKKSSANVAIVSSGAMVVASFLLF